MTKSCYLISIIILILGGNYAHGQGKSPLDQTLLNLQKQATDFPIEKVYLHLDKPFYGAGDTVWFKAYAVAGASHIPTPVSGVLNVELINSKNNIVRQLKVKLQDGLGDGDVALGDTIAAGNYRIRAYTNWMRNFGDEYFFDQTFPIINSVSNKVLTWTDYSFTQNNVNAVITYTGLEGKPLVNKPMNYSVNLGKQRVAQGNGVTDNDGKLKINFSNSVGNATTGEIATSIQVDAKTSVSQSIPVKGTSAKTDVQFMPEGGLLVNGIVCKVAFKAIAPDGLGANISGAVVDDQGKEITTFTSTHLGMGTFFLTPQTGRSYTAMVTYADGVKETINLPKAADKGYVMLIHQDSTNVVVKINQRGYEGDAAGVTLVARNEGQVFLQGQGTPGKTAFIATIPKNKLRTGVVQFTLFANSGQPLNERLVFVKNDDQLQLNAIADQTDYKTRQNVKMKLQVKDESGNPVAGDFSVAVIDESKVPVAGANEHSILSDLLLTSQLKGYIEQPNYYFANNNKTTAADLDALMLTQGYHRYEWSNAMNGIMPVINYQPEKALMVSGVLKAINGVLMAKSKISMVSASQPPVLMDTLTDKTGRFAFNVDFTDGTQFTLKGSSIVEGKARITFDHATTSVGLNKNFADIQINPDKWLEAYLKNDKLKYDAEVKSGVGNHTALLKEVKVNTTTRSKTGREEKVDHAVEFSSNLNGAGNADQVIIAEDFSETGCKSLQECLSGKLTGVVFIGGFPYTNRPITFDPGKRGSTGRVPMMLIVDGIAGSPLPPISAVSSIEVLRSGGFTAIYGTRAAGGVLILTTIHGNGFVKDAPGDGGTIKPQGFYKANVFYSPKYDVAKTDAIIPDLRSTIYWNPSVQTDAEGNASFSYYNADGKGSYRVVIEGMDSQGNLGRKVLAYKVD